MWGRQSYRLSDMDFEANLRDGIAIDWPIRYKDLAKWYDYVEKFIGVSGSVEKLPQLPDGKFLPAMEMNCVERHAKGRVEKEFGGHRRIIIGRAAHLTVSKKNHIKQARAACQYRNLCIRGCPYGAYFSTQSSTLPPAMATGRLTLRPNSLVASLIYDEAAQRATGVNVIDTVTGESIEYFANIIFLNASTVHSTAILMNTTSARYPNGLGNDSGALGHYLMDHHLGAGAHGHFDGFNDQYYYGRRPNGIYIPRYRNLHEKGNGYIRGFGYQGGASREGWSRGNDMDGFGAAFKNELSQPGPWRMGITGFGECLPYYENEIRLNKDKLDPFGQPTVVANAAFRDNEDIMRQDIMKDAAEMLEAAGFKDVKTYDTKAYIGIGIHEMGTARMGRDPKTSVLNGNNQVWGCPNVFVTDGACMTSSGCQNPSLTYMALTARAADFAVRALKRGDL